MSLENSRDSKTVPPKRRMKCPINGIEYEAVKPKTLLHHLKQPWQKQLGAEEYYFCTDAKCDVVYFGGDGSIFRHQMLRTPVWQKSESKIGYLCHCFGVTYKEALENSAIKEYVTVQTKASNCACEIRNPSGKCCLRDFPQQ